MTIHALNWYHVSCDEENCDAAVDVSVAVTGEIRISLAVTEKLRELHWRMETSEYPMTKTPTWCPLHGPGLVY